MAHNVTPLFSEERRHISESNGWLTGREVIQQTGIDKNDLVRFIRLGVIPPSLIRLTDADPSDTRRKTHFSPSVLGHVAMLKMLREEGHSVETIASELRQAEAADDPPEAVAVRRPRSLSPEAADTPAAASALYFHLPADAIAATTFFVNRDMHISWIKDAGDDRLSMAIRNEMNDNPSGTVFDIMLRASLKELVFDWQPLFSFIYRFLKETTSAATFERLAPMISRGSGETDDRSDLSRRHGATRPTVDSCPIRIEDRSGRMQAMRLYGLCLSEGSLFILEPERRPADALTGVAENAATASESDRKTPFSVLSARIDDSRNIVDTLLPEAYFRLMTRIWDESDRIVTSYGGQRAKRSGTDVQYIIPRQTDTDPAFDAIRCAIDLRNAMRAIEASLKAEGGWFADLRLNIGISSGRDHLRPDDLTASMAFMLPGGAADQAFHLCAIAHGGAILITKSAFGHLTLRQMERITFGIFRDDRLVPKIFARVSELPHAPDTPSLGQEIRSLFVTRIIDLAPDDGDGSRHG